MQQLNLSYLLTTKNFKIMNYKSPAVQAAAEIKEILKTRFPQTKFKIKSSKGMFFQWVEISWPNEDSKEEVLKLIGHYEKALDVNGLIIKKL